MIRLATLEDIPQVVSLIRVVHEASPYADELFSEQKSASFARTLITNPLVGIALVCEQHGTISGVLAGVVSDLPWADARLASELVWWTTKEAELFDGTKMFEAYEYWARNIANAKYIQTGNPTDGPADRLGKLYTRMGYTKKEELWLLHL